MFLLVCVTHVLETKNYCPTQEEFWQALSLYVSVIIEKEPNTQKGHTEINLIF